MKKMFALSLIALFSCAQPPPVQAPTVVDVPPATVVNVKKPAPEKKPEPNPCSSEVVSAAINRVCCKEVCKEGKCPMDEWLHCGELVIAKYYEQFQCPLGIIELNAECVGALFQDEQ